MKKLLGILAAFMLLLNVGCSQTEESEGSDNSAQATAAAGPVELAETEGPTVFVPANWVNSVVNGNEEQSEDYVILHAAWGEGEEFKEGHIPGSFHMNTDNVESDDTNWNILSAEEIEELLTSYGISKDTTVIVYSSDISAASRIAFTCIWAGVEDVRVLDGGYSAWEEAGYDVETGSGEEPTPVESFGTTVPAHPEYMLSMPEDVLEAQKDDNFRLVSIRSWEEFIGETSGYSYIDRAGEPEGAVWGHAGSDASSMEDYLNDDGTLKDLSEIIPLWEEWDITESNSIAFYCGTGWRATVPWLMAYEAGWTDIMLFDAGWYVWQMDDSLPVQTGDPREADCCS